MATTTTVGRLRATRSRCASALRLLSTRSAQTSARARTRATRCFARSQRLAVGFHNIEEELRSQYSLEYRPADFKPDGSFRTIYLQATDPRYKVRASKGYFAPRPQ